MVRDSRARFQKAARNAQVVPGWNKQPHRLFLEQWEHVTIDGIRHYET